MAERKPGFYWHVHHRVLMEWCYAYVKRETYIRIQKDPAEVSTRLRLFQPIKGALPRAVIKAWRTFDKAEQALHQARGTLDRARETYYEVDRTLGKAGRALNKAGRALGQAREAYYKARDTYEKAIQDNMPAIEALHKRECPNCPWDGKTIFPQAA